MTAPDLAELQRLKAWKESAAACLSDWHELEKSVPNWFTADKLGWPWPRVVAAYITHLRSQINADVLGPDLVEIQQAYNAPWQTFTASDGATGIRIREASELLAARVPELCTTDHGTHLLCPDCPTIGRLLAIGAAVMTAESSEDGWVVQLPGQLATNFSVPLLTQLREVQPT